MGHGNIWIKMPDTGIDRTPKEKYERFVKLATKKFIDDFKHQFPAHITAVEKRHRWLITQERMWLLKNIFIKAIEDAIENEDLLLVEEEHKNTIKELQEIIAVAKHELDYITEKANEKAEEEIKYG